MSYPFYRWEKGGTKKLVPKATELVKESGWLFEFPRVSPPLSTHFRFIFQFVDLRGCPFRGNFLCLRPACDLHISA